MDNTLLHLLLYTDGPAFSFTQSNPRSKKFLLVQVQGDAWFDVVPVNRISHPTFAYRVK